VSQPLCSREGSPWGPASSLPGALVVGSASPVIRPHAWRRRSRGLRARGPARHCPSPCFGACGIANPHGRFRSGFARCTESVGIIRVGEKDADAGKAFEGVGRRKEIGRVRWRERRPSRGGIRETPQGVNEWGLRQGNQCPQPELAESCDTKLRRAASSRPSAATICSSRAS